MSSAKYFIKIKTPYNVPVININEFYRMELFRSEYGIGSLYLDLPLKEFINQNIQTDWRIEVYRRTAGGELFRVGNTQWVVKLVRYKVDEQNETSIHILAYDAMYVLKQRVVAYVNGTPYTTKVELPADDMIKAIVRENLGSLAADYHRDLSQWLIVENDTSEAPLVTKTDFSFQQVMPILNDICSLSMSAGTYLSYDIVYDDIIGKLVFRTYTHQRGVNRGSQSKSPVYFAHHTDPVNVMGGGLNYASIEIDATDEKTYIYSGRQAEDTNAVFAQIGNDIILNESPFARSEDFITTGESVEYNDAMLEAHAWLQHKFRNLVLNAHIQETNDLQFERDYGFGDVVALRYMGTTLDIHLDEFKIVLEGNGAEDISVIATNMEKELLITPLDKLDASPLVFNTPHEDDESTGVELLWKYHTVAQSFIASASTSLDIDYIKVLMRRSGLPQRDVNLSLRADGGGKPGEVIAAPISNVPYYNLADGVYTWARFEFENTITIAAGTKLWITITSGSTKAEQQDYYLVGVDTNKRYPNGAMKVSTNGTTFTSYDADMLFMIGAKLP